MTRVTTWVLVAAALAGACSTSGSDEPRAAPADPLVLPSVSDKNADPGVVEIDLEARPDTKTYANAKPTSVWTYNGTIPGPFVDAKVGDRVVVHFKNSLPEPTTIHWHGIRLPATMDGSLAMQNPIAPGGTFEYAFTLKDAGLYWFHPHMRSDIQVQKGLYGVIRVRGAAEPDVDLERVLVLDDIRLDAEGAISEYLDDTAKMMGREGKTLLVNGLVDPRLDVAPGSLVRFRFVNVANGRFFNLRLPGHKLRVIGTDGGLVPKPYDVDTLLISPGERYDVVTRIEGAAGAAIDLVNEPYERGHESGGAAPMRVMRVGVSDAPRPSAKPIPDRFPEIERLPAAPVDSTIELDEILRGEDVVFTINGKAYPDVPPLDLKLGELRALEIVNKSEMDHPFHLHGFFFQLVARNGAAVPADALANKDTIIAPAKSSIRVVARFDEVGKWMYHCHILEHAEAGMMGEIHVR